MWEQIFSIMNIFKNTATIWNFLETTWNWEPLPSCIVAIVIAVLMFFVPIIAVLAIAWLIKIALCRLFNR